MNTSPSHVALIRGINVGRAKRVAMADLRALMADLGYANVQTLLNSGNVVFSTDEDAESAARRIEIAMTEKLGISARVLVLAGAELDGIVEENSLVAVAENPSRLFASVLADPKDVDRLKPLLEEDWSPEVLALGSRAAYVWCPDGIASSPLSEAIGRILRDAVTTRNWATTMRLHALFKA